MTSPLPASFAHLRARSCRADDVMLGTMRYKPVKSLWIASMTCAALVGGAATASVGAVLLFLASTGIVLLLGHSLGNHRKLIHNSYACPKWLEYLMVYLGLHVGLAGPLGLLRQHDLRDLAQRHARCHPYLRHGGGMLTDAWWQLHCDLDLDHPPVIELEPAIANDRFYQFLERTWMLQHLPVAVLFYLWGGWAFVFWGVCARVSAAVIGHWCVGYCAHNHGAMHLEVAGAVVQGRNVRFVSLLTMGECWHNNHHAYPGSARLGLRAGEWDPGWWALCMMERVGLVWNIVLPDHLPARPELVAAETATHDLKAQLS